MCVCVCVCVGTSLTYAEWAPLAPLTNSGLIRACAYFLTTQDFRLPACDILKQLSHRRQDKVCCLAPHLPISLPTCLPLLLPLPMRLDTCRPLLRHLPISLPTFLLLPLHLQQHL